MLTFGQAVAAQSGVFSLMLVGDGQSTQLSVDLSKGPFAMDLKSVTPVGVILTGFGSKSGTLELNKSNPMQVDITVNGTPLLDGQMTELDGFLTFAGVPTP